MHPLSFFSFGHPREKGSYKSYLLKDPDNGEYEIWSTYKWSSVCFSYGSKDGFVQFVKVHKKKPLIIFCNFIIASLFLLLSRRMGKR